MQIGSVFKSKLYICDWFFSGNYFRKKSHRRCLTDPKYVSTDIQVCFSGFFQGFFSFFSFFSEESVRQKIRLVMWRITAWVWECCNNSLFCTESTYYNFFKMKFRIFPFYHQQSINSLYYKYIVTDSVLSIFD